MAAKGLDIATIAEMTGLPVATVQTLLSQNRF
jgi:DNA-directed RNA polymerase specialized sigma24 family protein